MSWAQSDMEVFLVKIVDCCFIIIDIFLALIMGGGGGGETKLLKINLKKSLVVKILELHTFWLHSSMSLIYSSYDRSVCVLSFVTKGCSLGITFPKLLQLESGDLKILEA